MLFASVRSALRTSAPAQVRHASTEGAAHKAQQAAASAQATASKALSGVQSRVSGLLGAYREPVVYNAQVAKELAKQVYIAEKMSPPSFAQVSYTFRQFAQSAPNPSFWRQQLSNGAWKKAAIVLVEIYGIFCIGEMVGRRHVVGYRLDEDRYSKLT
ncbi:mitochondrial ATP synthase g subunit-domain-containing protein [Rhodotorula diobovata]|uniref:Mitochondrial ATP synthase g subunit-domain-containing protein n=1 Tax=Rhodotorula diobovata TaxID=5288 RepID=A0A5C5FP12_9BASI|nr:mitochondrial ATP synthase g subunit-domain-containing protein [Rhodotorula diobovata]